MDIRYDDNDVSNIKTKQRKEHEIEIEGLIVKFPFHTMSKNDVSHCASFFTQIQKFWIFEIWGRERERERERVEMDIRYDDNDESNITNSKKTKRKGHEIEIEGLIVKDFHSIPYYVQKRRF